MIQCFHNDLSIQYSIRVLVRVYNSYCILLIVSLKTGNCLVFDLHASELASTIGLHESTVWGLSLLPSKVITPLFSSCSFQPQSRI